MSKATKTSLIILLVLFIMSLILAGVFLAKSQSLTQDKVTLEQEIQRGLERDEKNNKDIGSLKQKIKEVSDQKINLEQEKEKLGKQIADLAEEKRDSDEQLRLAASKAEDVEAQLQDAVDEKDKFARRLEEAQSDRDSLVKKLKQAQEEKEDLEANQVAVAPVVRESEDVPLTPDGNEEYWAVVLRQKAELEVEVGKLKDQITDSSVGLVELKQKNSDLSIDLDSIKAQKEQLEQDMKYKEELVDNLSLELARSKNQKKGIEVRIEQLNTDNAGLRQEVQRLVASKSALEKSVAQISQQKQKMESELGQTESLIQSKIDEIWEIKQSLDSTIKGAGLVANSNKNSESAVELPPIVVSSQENLPALTRTAVGKVVSINEENHFVIIDIGEDDGAKLGDVFYVYRGEEQVSRLEVIQVRKDISAADIKEQKTKINIGDVVR